MTPQKAFDIVAPALLQQGSKATNDGWYCYRTRDGKKKCAIGHLIPDSLYSKGLEGLGVSYFFNNSLYRLCQNGEFLFPIEHAEFFVQLQGIHDKYSPSHWFYALEKLANKFNLSMECIKQLRPR